MESKHTMSNHIYPELVDESQIIESTNPFVRRDTHQQLSNSETSSKSGKRPRIHKPVYSVRLS